jgi:membrane-bound transcription factor site-1 protease
LAAHGYIARAPKWVGSAHGEKLELKFEASDVLWPWSGWVAVSMSVNDDAAAFEGVIEGSIEMAVGSEQGSVFSLDPVMLLCLPLR